MPSMTKATGRAAKSGQDLANLKQAHAQQNAVWRGALTNLQQRQSELKQQASVDRTVRSLSGQMAKGKPEESYSKAMRYIEAHVARSEAGKGAPSAGSIRQFKSLLNSMHPHRLPSGDRAIFAEQRDQMKTRLDAISTASAPANKSASMPDLRQISLSGASVAGRPEPSLQRATSSATRAGRAPQPAMQRSASAPALRSSNAAEGREIASQKMTWSIVMRNDKVGGSKMMLNEMKNTLDFPKGGKALSQAQRSHFESMLGKIPYQKMTDTDRASCFDLEAQVRQRLREM
ncbi:hypothetical protein FJU08_03745 [Martelella alba]|uniref:Uncharacterized protein n=2 Tax=Martelella alba TaxID=2590451 RepID=A0A506UG58_9HYPH|nr:hypothetical protein FJU08_03745 [Martelella alba]